MRRRLFHWSTRFLGAGLGLAVADLLLPGVRLTGSPARVLLVLALTAAVLVVATVAAPAPLYGLLNRARRRAYEAHETDSWDRVDPIYLLWVLNAGNVLLGVAVWALWAPLVLLLAGRAGPGLAVDGYGVAVAGALVVVAVWPLTRLPFRPLRGTALEVVRLALTLAGLALAVAVLGGVRLESGPGWTQLVVLAVLAQLYHVAWFELTAPYVTTLVRLVLAGLKLWALSWLSGWTGTPLRIEGFWSFALTAVIVVALLWPVRLAARARHRQEDLDLMMHDHMQQMHQMTMHQIMSRPYY